MSRVFFNEYLRYEMSRQQQDGHSNNVLEKIVQIDRKIKERLKILNKLQHEVDFISAKLRYSYVQKNELIKMIEKE